MSSTEQAIRAMDELKARQAANGVNIIQAIKAAHGLKPEEEPKPEKRAQHRLIPEMKRDRKHADQVCNTIIRLTNRGYPRTHIARVLQVGDATINRIWREWELSSKVLDNKLLEAGVATDLTEEEVSTYDGALRQLASIALRADKDSDKVSALGKLVELASLRRTTGKDGLPESKLVMEIEKPASPAAHSPAGPVSVKSEAPRPSGVPPPPAAPLEAPAGTVERAGTGQMGETELRFELELLPNSQVYIENEAGIGKK